MSFPVAGLSGTDRGNPQRNWYKFRGMQIVRRPPVSEPSLTSAQSFARQKFSIFSAQWGTLSTSERASWDRWARDDFRGVEGWAAYTSGRGAYVGIQWMAEALGIIIGNDPPTTRAAGTRIVATAASQSAPGFTRFCVSDVEAGAGVQWVYNVLGTWHALSPARKARKTDQAWWGTISTGQGVITGTGSVSGATSSNDFDRFECVAGDEIEMWFQGFSRTMWPFGLQKIRTVITT
jgi:hypothetical protein